MRVWPDFRHAIRSVMARPALTATAVASLALGIGANAALISLADGLGLRPLPIAQPDRLLRLFTSRGTAASGNFSYPDYRDVAGNAPAFAGIAAYGVRGVALTGADGVSEVVMLGIVTGNYFDTLGLRPAAGRMLRYADDTPSTSETVVISHRLWRQRDGGDSYAPGRLVELNGRQFAIVGVLPRDFNGLDPLFAPDVWVPAAAWPLLNGSREEFSDRGNQWLHVVGRLRDGSTLTEASAQIAALMADLARRYPATNRGRGSRVVLDMEYRRRVGRLALSVFGAIGGMVLLLACANVAGLLLARAEERRHEMAVRAAIGANRVQLVAQLLAEGVTLAGMGAAGGIALAGGLIRLLPFAIPPAPIPLGLAFRLDARVILFAVVAAAFTVIVFGVAPAIVGSRPEPGAVLKTGGPGLRGGRARARHVLVTGQIALALALATTAAFLVRSVWNLDRVDIGFDRRPMVMVTLSPSAVGYDEPRSRTFYLDLLHRAGGLPGVELVTLARRVPLSLVGGGATVIVNVPGRTPPMGERGYTVHFNVVAPRYFEAMGTPIVRGRDFGDADAGTSRRVAIVSEEFARRFSHADTVLGTHIAIGAGSPAAYEIVGVARDSKYNSVTEAADPYIYFPFAQRFSGEATLLMRTSGDERPLIASLRQEIASIDPRVPALQIMTMRSHLRAATAVERVTATLVSALGAVGLFLALTGIYGLVSYLVGRRTREIGIRMALGARPSDIAVEILRRAAAPIAGGVGAGLILAFVAATVAATSMYGVSASDPLTYAVGAAFVSAVALTASVVPARRAAHVDPCDALRRE